MERVSREVWAKRVERWKNSGSLQLLLLLLELVQTSHKRVDVYASGRAR
jgi:hypothetical protein